MPQVCPEALPQPPPYLGNVSRLMDQSGCIRFVVAVDCFLCLGGGEGERKTERTPTCVFLFLEVGVQIPYFETQPHVVPNAPRSQCLEAVRHLSQVPLRCGFSGGETGRGEVPKESSSKAEGGTRCPEKVQKPQGAKMMSLNAPGLLLVFP